VRINSYFLILIVFLCSAFLFQSKGYCSAGPQSKTNITSDSLTVNNKKNIAVFTGHVVAIKGGLKILSSALKVIYTKKNKIKMLIATGKVHIIKGKDNITGGRAVYYDKTRIAVITENPVAYEGKNKIAGKKIIINFKTGISTVIGGKKRVNAVVYSNKSLTVQKPSAENKKEKK
jgi:lipopolysaccharide export system protein LptA